MDKDYILSCIRDYAIENLMEPRWGMPRGYFEKCSYRWAAIEEIIRVVDQSELAPIEALSYFMRKTKRYAKLSRVSATAEIFNIEYEMAECIQDFLLALLERRN